MLQEGLQSLNALSGSTTHGVARHYLAGGWHQDACAHRRRSPWPLTAAQASIVRHAARCQKLYGPCPDSVQPRGALLELLKLPSMYEKAPLGLKDFDYDRLKVLHRPPRVVDVRDRRPPTVRHFPLRADSLNGPVPTSSA